MEGKQGSVPERRIRPAVFGDAEALAELETRIWRSAYRELLPQSLLDGLSEDHKAELWRKYLCEGITTFVLEEGARVLGFAGCGPAREPLNELPASEIYAIYLDDSLWGQGHGRALYERCRAELLEQGPQALVVWVLRQNRRARDFYERQGMVLEGSQKQEHLLGHPLPQVRYTLPT